jgi:aminopeptidase YwaD
MGSDLVGGALMSDERVVLADRDIIAELMTSDTGIKNLTVLCDKFGSRFGGTEGEKGAVQYMLERFKEYGLENVHAEEFTYNGWYRGPAKLEAVAPHHLDVKCISLPYTVAAKVEGELVNVGYGTPDEFEAAGDSIRGKVVMCSAKSPAFFRRTVHRAEKIGRAIAGGAIGFVWMRWDGGLLEETGSARWNMACEVPVVGVSREAGEELLRMQKDGVVRVKITTTDTVKPTPSWNVCAEIKGRTDPDKIIIAGAHFDGHDIAPGANDDGAGAMVVMEAARALARNKEVIGKTLRFICFPLEEIGLIGAYAYAKAHAEEMDKIEFMINLDGAGRSAAQPGITLHGKWSELFSYFKAIGKDMKQPVEVCNTISLYSDHFPFQLRGVAAGSLAEFSDAKAGVRGFGHTAADTLDKVSARGIENSAMFVARMFLRMANTKEWPAKRKSTEEVKKILGEYVEVLELEKRSPF